MNPPHFFFIFVIISPLKRTWTFIWTNLNSLYQRMICITHDWIRPAGSGEDFKKNQCIFTLSLLSPLGEELSLSYEQTWIPFAWGWSVPSLDKIGPVVLEKTIFKWIHPFLYFCDYLSVEEGLALYSNKLEFPLPKNNLYRVWLNLTRWFWRRLKKNSVHFYSFAVISPWREAIPFILTNLKPLYPRMICAKSGWNLPYGSGEEVENVKVYWRTDRQSDRRTDGRRTTGDQNSSLELSAQVS
jgi:hypothetical protein